MLKWEVEQPKGVIIIVHGAAEHHGRYKWVIEMCNEAGFHVIAGDLPGQGSTSRKLRGHIHSFDEYINIIASWHDQATQYNLPIFLLGHSMGGLAVIRTLQEKNLRVNGIILSSPCLGLMDNPSLPLELLTKGLNIVLPALRIESGISVMNATRNKKIQEVSSHDSLYVTKVSIRWYRELVKAIQIAKNKLDKFPEIPVLVMQGGEDKIVNRNDVKKWFDQLNVHEKTYKEWPDLYHEIFNEPEREDVFRFAKSFLEVHLKEATP